MATARPGSPLAPGLLAIRAVDLGSARAFRVPGLGATSVARLYDPGTDPNLAAVAEMVAEMVAVHDLPAGAQVIGEDPGGNLLLLAADGSIAFHAFCGWPLDGWPATVTLAPSWPAFRALLMAETEIDADEWSIDYRAVNRAAGHPEWGRDAPPGYHWHLDVPTQAMQLVPRDIHWMVPHVASTR